jgi:hypothetical protein
MFQVKENRDKSFLLTFFQIFSLIICESNFASL